MGGFTALSRTTGAAGHQLRLFFNTNNNNLALQLRSEAKANDDADTSWAAGENAYPGHLTTDGQLGNGTLRDTDFVFGITRMKAGTKTSTNAASTNGTADGTCGGDGGGSDDEKNVNISMVSPVYMPIDVTDLGNTGLAVASSDSSIFVFFTKQDEDGLMIHEYIIGDENQGNYNGTSRLKKGTQLAAYYNPEADRRYIIYQQATGLLCEYNIFGADTALNNTTDAKTGVSAMGVTYHEGIVYLYYSTSMGDLRRIRKTPKLGDREDAWDSPETVGHGSPNVEAGSQISVVTNGGKNHIFYKAVGGKAGSAVHLIDPVKPASAPAPAEAAVDESS